MTDLPARRRIIRVADFIAEIQLSASLEARERGSAFVVEPVDASLGICVDREMLLSALRNLLQNAFKFTRCHTQVVLKAIAVGDRVLIKVEDNCGGLPAGDVEEMFRPFTQHGHDKSGVGLGLVICRRSVEANGGTLRVRDVPEKGCIFTIELPRHAASLPLAKPLTEPGYVRQRTDPSPASVQDACLGHQRNKYVECK